VPLILASASASRQAMLRAAAVDFAAEPSRTDESLLKAQGAGAAETATELAKAKALDVSGRSPADWVIGSDSMLAVGERLFDKPATREEATDHLRYFSGRTMELTSAVALVRRGAVDWEHCETARLKVRPLSSAFIESYLDREWPEVGYCVGVFRMEGQGTQLFERVEGDHFTILGMPLLPLLGALRQRGLLLQ
jgi:septum formation protein